MLRDADQSRDKKTELQQKETDLFLKQNDMQRAKNAVKADFLQKNLTLLTSTLPGAMRQVEALIDATFPTPEDAFDVKIKARNIHDSAAEPPPQAASSAGQVDYKAAGFQFANAGHFDEAALSFGTAVSLAPNDIQALNALAYSQLQQGLADDAFKSISRAIELKPTDPRLRQLVAINATKILCAQDKHDAARAYLNVAIRMNSQLLPAAKGDGELLHMCGFEFK
jgi:tetratricopeptide (TPR) repeat protein